MGGAVKFNAQHTTAKPDAAVMPSGHLVISCVSMTPAHVLPGTFLSCRGAVEHRSLARLLAAGFPPQEGQGPMRRLKLIRPHEGRHREDDQNVASKWNYLNAHHAYNYTRRAQ